MSFSILDHLNLLTILETRNSFIEAQCPICLGKLKINNNKSSSSYGAYKCWTNFCSSSEIKKALGITKETLSNTFVSSVYIPPRVNYRKDKFCKVLDYTKPKSFNFYSPEYQKEITLTYYYYTDKVRVKRINTKDKKYLVLEVFAKGNWINKNITDYLTVLPLYGNGISFTQPNLFMAEGEKVADYLCYLGHPCVTPCTIGFDFHRLTLTLLAYSKYLKNVLYLPDYDSTGLAKAKIVLHSCWAAGIGAKFVTLDTLFPDRTLCKGMDLADFDSESVNTIMRKLYDES